MTPRKQRRTQEPARQHRWRPAWSCPLTWVGLFVCLLCFVQYSTFNIPYAPGHLCDEWQDWLGSDDRKQDARRQKLVSVGRRPWQSPGYGCRCESWGRAKSREHLSRKQRGGSHPAGGPGDSLWMRGKHGIWRAGVGPGQQMILNRENTPQN